VKYAFFFGRIKDRWLQVESDLTTEPAIHICSKESLESAARAMILTVGRSVTQVSNSYLRVFGKERVFWSEK
jgi:hypothetical protein